MKLKLEDIIDIAQFQMLQDRLNEINSFPSAIIDNDGNILTATAWQDACTKFHRQNPECEKECIKSDQYILSHLHEANPAVSYQCPHGLVDNATPIIIEGVHYGNFFTGQFFLKPPDLNFFRKQAKKYGFDEESYIEAIKKVPIWTQEQLEKYLFFIKGMIDVISSAGMKRLKEIETSKEQAETSELNKQIINSAKDGIIVYGLDLRYKVWNPAMEESTGIPAEKVLGRHPLEVFPFHKESGLIDRLNKALQGEPAETITFPYYLTEIGKSGWASDTSNPLRNQDGQIIGVIGIVQEISESKKVQDALKKSEENLLQAQYISRIGDFSWEIASGNVTWSAGMHHLLKYDIKEKIDYTKVNESIHHPDDLEGVTKWLFDSIASGKEIVTPNEYRLVCKDGDVLHVRANGRIEYQDGKAVMFFGTCQDITEQKIAEQKLRESENDFRDVLNNSPFPVAVADSNDTKIYFWSQRATELFGHTPSTVDEWYRSAYPDPVYRSEVISRWKPFLDKAFKTKETVNTGEYNIACKDGSMRICELYINLIGEYLIVTFNDITKRKKSESDIQKFEWLLEKDNGDESGEGKSTKYIPSYGDVLELNTERVILDGIGEDILSYLAQDVMELLDTSIAVYERNGDYAYGLFESGWCQLMDSASRKLCNTDDNKEALSCGKWLCHENCWNDSAKAAIESGLPTDIDCVGGIKLYGVPIIVDEKAIGAVNIGYSDPPSDSESIEALASKYNLTYDTLIQASKKYKPRPAFIIDIAKKRTQIMAQVIGIMIDRKNRMQELKEIESKTMEQEKMAAIGRVAGKMAHDMNNVLSVSMSLSDLILHTHDLSPALKADIEAIKESAERGADITRNLLFFAKDQETKFTQFNLNTMISGILRGLHQELSGIQTTTDFSRDTSEVIADVGMVENALLNLLHNSIHGMSKTEKPKLIIRTHRSNGNVKIVVEDNGCGIPEEHLHKVFDVSFTLKGSRDNTHSYSNDIKGSGYGMANVKKSIDKHGGTIEIESQAGHGTTVTISLPEIDADVKEDVDAGIQVHDSIKGKRILVVEDEQHISNILYKLLRMYDHKVNKASNGQEAVDLFSDNEYDAISLDFLLPDMNGMEVYRKIREANKDVPVIFVSGNFEFKQSMIDLKKTDPNVDHIAKPFNNVEYLNKIHEWLKEE